MELAVTVVATLAVVISIFDEFPCEVTAVATDTLTTGAMTSDATVDTTTAETVDVGTSGKGLDIAVVDGVTEVADDVTA